MRPFGVLICWLIFIFAACKKNEKDEPSKQVKVEVVKGNNQVDTAGNVLPDSIQIKVTADNAPVANSALMIVQSGCAGSQKYYVATNADGIAGFAWRLNGTIGNQSINIYAVDSLNKILDSTTANAQGFFAEHTWIPCNCFPAGFPDNPVQLADGKVLCYYENMYQSADDGKTWSVMQSYPGVGPFNHLAVYSNNVFAIQTQKNFYYSPDNGASWQQLHSTDSLGQLALIKTTRSGKLFLNTSSGVYLSLDLGESWINLSRKPETPLGTLSFTEVTESPEGSLYLVSEPDLWISDDGGASWRLGLIGKDVTAAFADDNGDVYFGQSTGSGSEIYRVRNQVGSTLYAFTDTLASVANITLFSKMNGNYYLQVGGRGLFTTGDFISFRQLNSFGLDYCVTGNNTIIQGNFGYPPAGQLMYNVNP